MIEHIHHTISPPISYTTERSIDPALVVTVVNRRRLSIIVYRCIPMRKIIAIHITNRKALNRAKTKVVYDNPTGLVALADGFLRLPGTFRRAMVRHAIAFVNLAVSAQIRDDGKIAATSMNFASERYESC